MTFEEFARFIADLLEYGEITVAEAEELLSRFDEFSDLELPMLPEEISRYVGDYDIVVEVLLLSFLSDVIKKPISRELLPSIVANLSQSQRVAVLNVTQDKFVEASKTLAADVTQKEISILEWQQSMNDVMATFLRSTAQVASGSVDLTKAVETKFTATLMEQQAYLSRFADTYALSVIRDKPMSVGQIANRAESYAGALRAFGFEVTELVLSPGYGWVHIYVAADDQRTCSECIAAAASSPYLAGNGPMPGRECLGAQNCRCNRYAIYDTQEYERLTGSV